MKPSRPSALLVLRALALVLLVACAGAARADAIDDPDNTVMALTFGTQFPGKVVGTTRAGVRFRAAGLTKVVVQPWNTVRLVRTRKADYFPEVGKATFAREDAPADPDGVLPRVVGPAAARVRFKDGDASAGVLVVLVPEEIGFRKNGEGFAKTYLAKLVKTVTVGEVVYAYNPMTERIEKERKTPDAPAPPKDNTAKDGSDRDKATRDATTKDATTDRAKDGAVKDFGAGTRDAGGKDATAPPRDGIRPPPVTRPTPPRPADDDSPLDVRRKARRGDFGTLGWLLSLLPIGAILYFVKWGIRAIAYIVFGMVLFGIIGWLIGGGIGGGLGTLLGAAGGFLAATQEFFEHHKQPGHGGGGGDEQYNIDD